MGKIQGKARECDPEKTICKSSPEAVPLKKGQEKRSYSKRSATKEEGLQGKDQKKKREFVRKRAVGGKDSWQKKGKTEQSKKGVSHSQKKESRGKGNLFRHPNSGRIDQDLGKKKPERGKRRRTQFYGDSGKKKKKREAKRAPGWDGGLVAREGNPFQKGNNF